MEHRRRVLPHLAAQRCLDDDPRCAARTGAGRSGAGADTERGDHRQPEREDDGKRGVRGYDAGKKINGRKRHIVVDTLGLILAVVVHAASVQDRDGAKLVIAKLGGRFPRLRLLWADGGYAGQLIGWAQERWGWTVAIVKRGAGEKGFAVLPRRWIVERTFGWLGRYRVLSKDYEQLPESSEALVLIVMIQVMLKRLEPP